MSEVAPWPATLVEALLAGQPRALARAITVVENAGAAAPAILAAIRPHLGRAHVVGITGPPGAGKSTLIGALIRELRRRGRTVGVLAVDPSSPISGGAILGDRVRMNDHAGDAGVFVRSLASRGHLGGLFRTAWGVVQVMDAWGPDFIVLETVGSGQSEVEVADFAHTRLVLCAPGAGDDIQAIKAGILEIADILVVNKADLPQAEQTVRQLEAMLALRAPARTATAVIATTATTGQGIAALADRLEATASAGTPARRQPDRRARLRRILADAAADAARARVLAADAPAFAALYDRVDRCELGLDEAAHEALRLLAPGPHAGRHSAPHSGPPER
jgi:LAO/AO transport system kinase